MTTLKITFEITPTQLDILIKSFGFFEIASNTFDNQELEVEIAEIRTKILNNLVEAGIEKE